MCKFVSVELKVVLQMALLTSLLVPSVAVRKSVQAPELAVELDRGNGGSLVKLQNHVTRQRLDVLAK